MSGRGPGPLRRALRALLLLGIGTVAGFAFAVAHYRVPALEDFLRSPAVSSIVKSRPVQATYYFLKPKLGLGWTGAFARAKEVGDDGLTPEQREEAAALLALGYAEGVTPSQARTGTTRWLRGRAYEGYTLVNDGFEAEAVLTDMEGNVVHRWGIPFREAFPDSDSFDGAAGTYNWRRVKLLPEGELLAIYDGHGLVRLDRDSKVLWAFDDDVHHDMELDESGDVWVLSRSADLIPRVKQDRPVLHDFLVRLDPTGAEVQRISLLEAIERSPYSALLDSRTFPPSGDIMHTNEIEILDGRLADRIPAFAAGNLLLTIRNMNTIAVLDPRAEKIVWAQSGLWRMQHDVHVLENGNLLTFDNRGHEGRSRVIETDPVTQEVRWVYHDENFDSQSCGASQRLPNGNTLISESNYGRAFEVEPDGTIVWEYYTPDRTGDDDEFIAQLFEAVRIEPESVAWLEEPDRSQVASDQRPDDS